MQITDLNSNSFIHNPYITTVTHAMNAQRKPPPKTPYFHSYLIPPPFLLRNHHTDPNNVQFATEDNFTALNCPELPVQRSRLVTRESVRSLSFKKTKKQKSKKKHQKTNKTKKLTKKAKLMRDISLYFVVCTHICSNI